MNELAQFYKDMRELSSIKKQSNLEFSISLLNKLSIDYQTKNNGIHLIVIGNNELIDFWPTTGKFVPRGGIADRGVLNLIKRIRPTL